MTAREIQSRSDLDLVIVGFVDDNPQIQNTVIAGVKVLGTTADLPQLVRKHSIDHVVISLVQGSRKQFRQIIECCESASAKVRVIPSLSEILQGKVSVSRIRDVQVEDLLGREPILLEEGELAQFLCEKVVMVTGAGGSIGAELVRQVARFNPTLVLLVERAEPSLFEIHRELVGSHPSLAVTPLLADICDENRMRRIFDNFHPQVIFHAAAHKHVPMMEMNPSEAVKNNVLATRSLAELAGQRGVETFVLVSTDKAVCPSSIMGATKRVSELVIQSLNRRYDATRYVAVRFGNVIGSTGSVVKIFQDQIRKGGPVTVTDPRMFRYFMTIPEATRLLLQAGAIGEGGEILILDMGEPVSILELAEDTITLSGLKPFEDIDVVFTGPRPGEKLLEQLDMQSESFTRTRHPKIFIGKIAVYPEAEVNVALKRLEDLAAREAHDELRNFLSELLPEAELNHQHPRRENTAGRLGRQNGRLKRDVE
jgi:FlaA1/EpsC-like NDP-sugar epimerase